jgi:membrane-bound lytic murein transglycosylase D
MKRRSFASLFCLLFFSSASYAIDPAFTTDGLQPRIDFWKKIFTQYGEKDVVIHDTFHVDLIYDVATDADSASRVAAVRNALRELRGSGGNTENLSSLAQRIHGAMTEQGYLVTPSLLDTLAGRIHTQRGIKERFQSGVIRSGRYVEEFKKILAREGVPAELALLPLVESSFENVRSRVGAVGVWQFMRSTGRLYMTVSTRVDDRLDPFKSASAAARLLRDNHKALGAWPLAITAYNHGRGGMLRAQSQHGSDISKIIERYKSPIFGYASMNFYAEFVAAVEVYDSYPVYFGELILDDPMTPTPAAKPAPPKVQVAKAAPKPAPVQPAGEKYKVRSGDTLWDIAQRFGTSIRALMDNNNLSHSSIYAGQMLLIR